MIICMFLSRDDIAERKRENKRENMSGVLESVSTISLKWIVYYRSSGGSLKIRWSSSLHYFQSMIFFLCYCQRKCDGKSLCCFKSTLKPVLLHWCCGFEQRQLPQVVNDTLCLPLSADSILSSHDSYVDPSDCGLSSANGRVRPKWGRTLVSTFGIK